MSRQANTKLYTYMYQFKPSSRKLLNMLHYYKALHTITKLHFGICIYKYLVRSFLRLTKLQSKVTSICLQTQIQKLENQNLTMMALFELGHTTPKWCSLACPITGQHHCLQRAKNHRGSSGSPRGYLSPRF